MKNKYAKIFACLKAINGQPGVNLTHKQVVKDFTGGRTESLTDLSTWEVQELERRLVSMSPRKENNEKLDNTRKAIISQFLGIGKSVKDAIAWAEKYGVNGKKKRFNDYTGQELFILLQNAKKMKSYTEKIITKNGI